MKTLDTISAGTHVELLNRLLHKHYKAYMKCTYDLHNGYKIWIIKLDGQQSSLGWTNSILNYGNTVIEEYTGDPRTELPTHKYLPYEKRLIFGVYGDTCADRFYMFHGVFEMDKSSNVGKRIWNKIGDSYNFDCLN